MFLVLLPIFVVSVPDPELVWRHTLGVPECPSQVYGDGKVYIASTRGVITVDEASGEDE